MKFGRVGAKSAQAWSIRGRIDKIYEDMLKHDGFVTAQKVKLFFLGVGVMDDTILKVFNDQNEHFKILVEKEERSQRTYYKYSKVYNHLSTFIKERYHSYDITFRELTGDFIREFDFYLRYHLQCSHNTVWVYMMPVLSLVKLAMKKGLIRDNPFQDYEISMEETDRGYILKEDVEKLMMCVPPHPRYGLVKDLFIFSCFTGLAYVDIKKLTKSNIQFFF
ncbi:site-specific integrase [Elizabethkingia argenteiflava]